MVTRVRFEYRLANGLRRRVIAAPSVRPVPAFERQDAAGKWHQDQLQDVPPRLLMELGRIVAEHDTLGTVADVDGDTLNIVLGGALDEDVIPDQVVGHGWRAVVTFPVELEESEALLLDNMLRDKFIPERATRPLDAEAERMISKMGRVIAKFVEKRRSDAEFAASLTDEEREIIRARRANAGRKDK